MGNSVKEQYKISDFDAVLRDAGLTKEFVKGKFSNLETQVAAQAKLDRENQEADFWQTSTDLASETQNVLREIDNSINLHGNNINELLTDTNIYLLDISSIVSSFESNTYTQLNETDELLKSINSYSSHLYKKFDTFQKSWNEYFIEHKVYNNSFTHETYDKIARKEKESSETAIYALAEALTQNDVKLLLDPTVQTNALLAQILKVVSALLTQTSSGSNQVALPSTLTKLLLNNSNI